MIGDDHRYYRRHSIDTSRRSSKILENLSKYDEKCCNRRSVDVCQRSSMQHRRCASQLRHFSTLSTIVDVATIECRIMSTIGDKLRRRKKTSTRRRRSSPSTIVDHRRFDRRRPVRSCTIVDATSTIVEKTSNIVKMRSRPVAQ